MVVCTAPGVQRGRMELDSGCLRFHLHWEDPLRGTATDVFRLTSTDTMVLASEAKLQGSGAQAATVQHEEGEGRAEGRVPGQKPTEALSATFRCLCRRETPIGIK